MIEWDEAQLLKLESKIRNYAVQKDPVYNIPGTFHYGTTYEYEQSTQAPNPHSLYIFLDQLEPLNRIKP